MLGKINDVAYVAESALTAKPEGIVLQFHGLGSGELRKDPSADELFYGEFGAVCVYPYYGPWSWMNRGARAMVDELVTAVRKKFHLKADCPIISTGGSMGGTSALLFTRYTKHPVTACFANCPAADITFHYRERPDLPRTFHNAFYGYKGPFQQLLKEHSPLHQVAKMPRIPYLVLQGGKDTAVSQKKHADPFVRAMKKHKHNVEYILLPEMGHCGPIPHGVAQQIREFVMAPFSAMIPF